MADTDTAEILRECRDQIESDVEAITQTGRDIVESATQVLRDLQTAHSTDSVTDRVLSVVSDTQDVETPKHFMVQIYAWSSVCALGAMVGMYLGHTILVPFIESVAESSTAMLLGCIVLAVFGIRC
ncbi:hypothetical protein OSTOST_17649 [Ostertagia ostertagi]